MTDGYIKTDASISTHEFLRIKLADLKEQLACAVAGAILVRDLGEDDLVILRPGQAGYEPGRAAVQQRIEDEIGLVTRWFAKNPEEVECNPSATRDE